MYEMPKVEVHLVQSTEAPGGIGETGTSCFTPALTNAIFRGHGKACPEATGRRPALRLKDAGRPVVREG